MIHDPIFAERIAVFLFANLIVIAAAYSAWHRRGNQEQRHTFWFSVGIIFHWMATGNSCLFSLLDYMGITEFPFKAVLLPLNLGLIFIAGCFYFRALTLHISETLWRFVVSGLIIAGMGVYGLQMFQILGV